MFVGCVQLEEPVATIVLLAQHLEASKLQDFWVLTASCRDTLNGVPGFYDSVREYVLHTLGITFQRVSKRVLADCLKLEGQSLDDLIAGG